MWLGLYIIAGGFIGLGAIYLNLGVNSHFKRFGHGMMAVGIWFIFFTTIAYGINLIINN